MKLIDLLVQELPKRGGWPKNANEVPESANVSWGVPPWGCNPMAFCMASHEIVTKEQYEAALSAEQHPVWDGEGLPPVGTKCEFKCATGVWSEVEITAIARNGLCFVEPGKDGENYVAFSREFRPIRSEADKNRDDAIAAGKIPHIKLSD